MTKFLFSKITLSIFSILLILIIAYFNLLSNTIQELNHLGVDQNLLYLVLIIPFITLFISICRIVIGFNINAFHIPILLILSSFILDLYITIFILLAAIISGMLVKLYLTKFHFHFISKLAIILSGVSIISIFLFPILIKSSLFAYSFSPLIILYTTIVIAIIVEKYLNFQITKSKIIDDLGQIFRTLVFCIIAFLILGGKIDLYFFELQFTWLRSTIIAYPETVFVTLLLNIIIGQYTGLRLDEIFRFRKLIFKK